MLSPYGMEGQTLVLPSGWVTSSVTHGWLAPLRGQERGQLVPVTNVRHFLGIFGRDGQSRVTYYVEDSLGGPPLFGLFLWYMINCEKVDLKDVPNVLFNAISFAAFADARAEVGRSKASANKQRQNYDKPAGMRPHTPPPMDVDKCAAQLLPTIFRRHRRNPLEEMVQDSNGNNILHILVALDIVMQPGGIPFQTVQDVVGGMGQKLKRYQLATATGGKFVGCTAADVYEHVKGELVQPVEGAVHWTQYLGETSGAVLQNPHDIVKELKGLRGLKDLRGYYYEVFVRIEKVLAFLNPMRQPSFAAATPPRTPPGTPPGTPAGTHEAALMVINSLQRYSS